MTVLDHLGFGCVALSTLGSQRASRNLLEGVFELGLRHFDTAPIYGRGYSERLLGRIPAWQARPSKRRDQIWASTCAGAATSRRAGDVPERGAAPTAFPSSA